MQQQPRGSVSTTLDAATALDESTLLDASPTLARRIRTAIDAAGGWLPFDRFMAMALYEPGLGYYAAGHRQFGAMPSSGSDFVTAPELSPYFARALARQVAQALEATDSRRVWEFGAGSGALAAELVPALDALGVPPVRYTVVELSGALRSCQQRRLAALGDRVAWVDALPDAIDGVVVGNEVLDAMPVQLLHHDGRGWQERGVGVEFDPAPDEPERFAFRWVDRPTDLRPPLDPGYGAGATVEVHPEAEAFIATLADRLTRGAAFFIDYGFPAGEYYHPQRSAGTLMCHRGHRADTDPLVDVGAKDITAHVDWTGIAIAGQEAGLDVIGYASQARFLLDCGLLELLPTGDWPALAAAQKLVNEHEMGELFKVIGFAKGAGASLRDRPLGFASGDRTHTL